MTRRTGALAVIAAAAAISGCGGSDRLSSSDLHNQATEICALTSRQTIRIPTPGTPAAAATFLRQGIAAMTPELAKLRKLRPPATDQSVFTATISASANKLDLLRGAARQINSGEDPVATMQTLEQQLAPVVQQENGGWQALGIPACVNR